MVLPLSSVSGREWERARTALAGRCADVTVVTVAEVGNYESSFSADTGMAECLLIARKGERQPGVGRRAKFVMLNTTPESAVEADLLADAISRISISGNMSTLEGDDAANPILVGSQEYGFMLDAPLPDTGPWPLVGIAAGELAQTAYKLERGALRTLTMTGADEFAIPMVAIGDIAGRGPYHADIYWNQRDGTPRGPFDLIKPATSAAPSYPMLWAHDAKRERNLVVEPDSEGRIKRATGGDTRAALDEKAARVWATATRAHYNRDLRFNSQSLIAAITERPSVGGRAWPSVIFSDKRCEFPFALWCNSTLGLLMHWWVSNKTQSGRGTMTVTGIPNIPTLDVRALDEPQLLAAATAFGDLSELRFLPFDQIDEDPSRAELDRRLIVDVLGLPANLCVSGGPIDLIRRKLAREPQIHGGKRSRVVFRESFEDDGRIVVSEHSERRSDR